MNFILIFFLNTRRLIKKKDCDFDSLYLEYIKKIDIKHK